ncbi:LL-diaminopimelate aminotransferase [Candidatus Epulonipiscium fishelsonii]|uniref:LL-diaminopimelate aminotransferase n=1 Tax=Candidatus Epulonipiscium fishelsonii TaxID=77094 RepID=A0ACC8XER0_9FIRM|nr:LL-diaminopimelate aminotransferase [Epulopiscium sp. SCG-B11WGA-EpuloA1]ONI43686.1 LL-diaminopimelate aminotransferase [Epulopiscium sp. SCG-B05WGA-EpuloA1]
MNKNFLNLKDSYLFSTIARKVNEFQKANPNTKIIRLGIGDVTLPLTKAVITALKEAVLEMGEAHTFKGYGPEQGYEFLRIAIKDYYKEKNVSLKADEIFVSDGAKSDIGNILDIFSSEYVSLIPNPVYPAYLDANIMAGRKVNFLNGSEANNFLPMPEDGNGGDLIYLCSPNNPTGSTYTKEQLKVWVDYANKNNAVILFDSAYECFVRDKNLPTSIFEIEGAKTCAIEFCSFSKTAGFTGTRCGYTVVPHDLVQEGTSLNKLWLRRQTTKFNGVPYIIQRGASAIFTPQGKKEVEENIKYYLENAKIIRKTFKELGFWFVGGDNSPYIWLKCPDNMDSWSFFDKMLTEANIVGTPGAGFGTAGEGYFRISAFGARENVIEAMDRIKKLY